MKTNRTRPVGPSDVQDPSLGQDLGTENARGIKEDIEEDPVVGRMIGGKTGIPERKTQIGHIGVEATGRAVHAIMQEGGEALTVPWQKGWVSNTLHPAQISNRSSANRDLLTPMPFLLHMQA